MFLFPETAIFTKTRELARTFSRLMSDLPNLHTVTKAETALAFPSPSLRMRKNASSLPMLFTSKIRDREVLSFIHFTHGFRSLHASELTYFWKLCQARQQ